MTRSGSIRDRPAVYRELGRVFLFLRRYPEARQAIDAGLVLSPDNLSLIERRAMTFLGEGNLAGAREYVAARTPGVEPTKLVAYLALYWDLGWVLTEEQKDVLLRLTPAAFDDDRGAWGLCLARFPGGGATSLKRGNTSTRLGRLSKISSARLPTTPAPRRARGDARLSRPRR